MRRAQGQCEVKWHPRIQAIWLCIQIMRPKGIVFEFNACKCSYCGRNHQKRIDHLFLRTSATIIVRPVATAPPKDAPAIAHTIQLCSFPLSLPSAELLSGLGFCVGVSPLVMNSCVDFWSDVSLLVMNSGRSPHEDSSFLHSRSFGQKSFNLEESSTPSTADSPVGKCLCISILPLSLRRIFSSIASVNCIPKASNLGSTSTVSCKVSSFFFSSFSCQLIARVTIAFPDFVLSFSSTTMETAVATTPNIDSATASSIDGANAAKMSVRSRPSLPAAVLT
mmetsp:Transcript_123359/g.195637  ORF Transcript_123359/g.195637 Transcript_123359/m.195637 type:complete len:279 (-) Transcript_123359:1149-1985(-)